jgi:hypothetical protein
VADRLQSQKQLASEGVMTSFYVESGSWETGVRCNIYVSCRNVCTQAAVRCSFFGEGMRTGSASYQKENGYEGAV